MYVFWLLHNVAVDARHSTSGSICESISIYIVRHTARCRCPELHRCTATQRTPRLAFSRERFGPQGDTLYKLGAAGDSRTKQSITLRDARTWTKEYYTHCKVCPCCKATSRCTQAPSRYKSTSPLAAALSLRPATSSLQQFATSQPATPSSQTAPVS